MAFDIVPSFQTVQTRRRVIKFPGFSWDRVNFLPSSCCVLDLVWEECSEGAEKL